VHGGNGAGLSFLGLSNGVGFGLFWGRVLGVNFLVTTECGAYWEGY